MKTTTTTTHGIRTARIRKTLALAVLAALYATSAFAAPSATTGSPVTVARTTRLQPGDTVTGALPMNQPIHVEVALKMRDREGLEALIADNARRQMAGGRPRLLTPAGFLATHAPTQQQAQAVASYLTGAGFANVTIAPNRMLVSADGTALAARNAFMTSFAQVRTHDGRMAYANTAEAHIPLALADKILAVTGLQNVHVVHAEAQGASVRPQLADSTIPHMPTEFPAIYGGASAPVAADITVGIVDNGDYVDQIASDVNTFTAFLQLPAASIKVIRTGSGLHNNGDYVEMDSDSQSILGMAGGRVKKIVFYTSPARSSADFTANLNTVVARDDAQVIDEPFGVCETDARSDGSAAAQDAIFATAVAQGQTFAVATGNAGADECGNHTSTPLWPASSRYVVAVAGTHLNATATDWINEKAWINTGGSPSTFEPMPPWQSAFGVPGTTRGAVDVTFDADYNTGSKVFVQNVLGSRGGTGLSAALFTALWARVLQANGLGFGFAGPILYGLPAADFHDVVIGNNHRAGAPNEIGFQAGPGYDFASGRGSLLMDKVIADSKSLGNQPPVADFSFAASGLTVQFTDTSTDADGTIVKHAWAFGDGTTSTAANPSHTYAAYKNAHVTETVVDDKGSSGSTTKTVALALAPTQLIKNPSFESGSNYWHHTQQSTNDVQIVQDTSRAYDRNWSAFLIPETGAGSNLFQQVTIPGIYAKATLKVPVWIQNGTPPDTHADNHLAVQLIDPSTGAVVATLGSVTNLDPHACNNCSKNYQVHFYDLTPYIGQTLKLNFNATADDATQRVYTYFFLDDITLVAQ